MLRGRTVKATSLTAAASHGTHCQSAQCADDQHDDTVPTRPQSIDETKTLHQQQQDAGRQSVIQQPVTRLRHTSPSSQASTPPRRIHITKFAKVDVSKSPSKKSIFPQNPGDDVSFHCLCHDTRGHQHSTVQVVDAVSRSLTRQWRRVAGLDRQSQLITRPHTDQPAAR